MKKLESNTISNKLNQLSASYNPEKVQELLVNVIFNSLNGNNHHYLKVRDDKHIPQKHKAFIAEFTAFDRVKSEEDNSISFVFNAVAAKSILDTLEIEVDKKDGSFGFDALALALPMWNAKKEADKVETPLNVVSEKSSDSKLAKMRAKMMISSQEAIESQLKLLEKQTNMLKAQLGRLALQEESQAPNEEPQKQQEPKEQPTDKQLAA